jgi:hypothetical protein
MGQERKMGRPTPYEDKPMCLPRRTDPSTFWVRATLAKNDLPSDPVQKPAVDGSWLVFNGLPECLSGVRSFYFPG